MVGKKTSDQANFKCLFALTVLGERRLRCIVRSQQSQTLARITTQLSDGASRTVSKRTVQCSPTRMVSLTVDLQEYHCSMLAIRLYFLPGQESTETGM
ncbi:uncharacterized protein TNCV_2401871 [Trichonephila clavipes]|nr:uncharacterized protein TNCV_2401871 [Trichonephila clavipes]